MERRKDMKGYIIILLILISCICFVDAGFGQEKIKIGIIDSFSGMAALFARDRLNGGKIAQKEINETGGILGREIEFILRDDMLTPDTAVKHMEELVYREKVMFIIGPSSSGVLLAMGRWAKDNKFPFFAWDARSEKAIVQYGHRYIFRSLSDTNMDAAAMARFFSKKPWDKYATIAGNYEYGHAMVENFGTHMKKLKPQVEKITSQWPKIGEIDYTAYITPILAGKPNFVYSGLWGGDSMAFMKQGKTYGLLEKTNLVTIHVGQTFLNQMGKVMPEGVWVGTNYTFKIDTPENKAFVSSFRKEFGMIPGDQAFCGYVGVKFVGEGMRKARSLDKEKIIDALEGLTIKTPAGPITIRKFDHQGNMGLFIGRTKVDPEYPDFLVLAVEEFVPGDEIMTPISMIQELRAKEK
jgi:branched-chain amino acid transport system substrate-binding protein